MTTTPTAEPTILKIRDYRGDSDTFNSSTETYGEVHPFTLTVQEYPVSPPPPNKDDWIVSSTDGERPLKLKPDKFYKHPFVYVPVHLFQRKLVNVSLNDLGLMEGEAAREGLEGVIWVGPVIKGTLGEVRQLLQGALDNDQSTASIPVDEIMHPFVLDQRKNQPALYPQYATRDVNDSNTAEWFYVPFSYGRPSGEHGGSCHMINCPRCDPIEGYRRLREHLSGEDKRREQEQWQRSHPQW